MHRNKRNNKYGKYAHIAEEIIVNSQFVALVFTIIGNSIHDDDVVGSNMHNN